MISEEIEIVNETGLHTRPAKRVVAVAKNFESDSTLHFGEKQASMKSLLKLMKLGISQKSRVKLVCEGSDEEAAFSALSQFLRDLED